MKTQKVMKVINHVLLFMIFGSVLFAFIMHCSTTCHAKNDTTCHVKNDTTKITKNLVILPSTAKADEILPGYTVEINGVKYPIYKSTRSYYYWRTSKKSGKQYKCYLTAKQKQQLGLAP